jgi:hypothetical protein
LRRRGSGQRPRPGAEQRGSFRREVGAHRAPPSGWWPAPELRGRTPDSSAGSSSPSSGVTYPKMEKNCE